MLFIFLTNKHVCADMFDTYGFGTRGMAMAGAICASVDDPSGVYYNPAGLGKVKGHRLDLSYTYTDPSMDVDGMVSGVPKDDDLSFGAFVIAMAIDINKIARLPRQVTFGMGMSLMDDLSLLRLEDLEEYRYTYVKFGAPIKRSAIYLGLGIEAIPDFLWLGMGAHAMVTGDAAANLTLAAKDLSTTQDVIPAEQNIWMNMKLKLNPTIGIIVSPSKGLNIGVSYRDDIDVDIDPFNANLDITIGEHAARINAYTAILTFWNPRAYQAGISYKLEKLAVEVDITRDNWSDFERSIPRELRGAVPKFDDVYSYRFGLEYGFPNLDLWAGYQYAPTPVPDQPGNSNYLDSDRHILSLGIGGDIKKLFGFITHPIWLGITIQDQILRKRSFHKVDTPDYTLKGNVLSCSVSIRVEM